jgi:hypothetical protein
MNIKINPDVCIRCYFDKHAEGRTLEEVRAKLYPDWFHRRMVRCCDFWTSSVFSDGYVPYYVYVKAIPDNCPYVLEHMITGTEVYVS